MQYTAAMSPPTADNTDAPPAYTPATNALPVPLSTNTATTASSDAPADDAYAFLNTFDTAVLIDDSGSMAGGRWGETRAALESIIPIITLHDADGIDLYFLNAPASPWHRNVKDPATVREIFSAVSPRGGTPTGQRLNGILKPYLRNCDIKACDNVKPLNLIVVTDGEPSDDVESVLISAAKKLDRLDAPAWQVGVQFFQVGRDEEARKHLRQLDDELAEIAGEEIRDMVDTVPFLGAEGERLTGDGILKVSQLTCGLQHRTRD